MQYVQRIVFVMMLSAQSVEAQDRSDVPSGPEPSQFVLARVEGDQVVFRSLAKVTITVEQQDKPPVSKEGVSLFPTKRHLKDLQAFDMSGKGIEKKVMLEALKKEKLVVLSFGGKVDPLYGALFKSDTMNLVLPKDKAFPSGGELPALSEPKK
jgi:hypothetical protein